MLGVRRLTATTSEITIRVLTYARDRFTALFKVQSLHYLLYVVPNKPNALRSSI